MKKSFAFAASFRAARLPLGAALGVALILACAPVRAEQCPRGQFFLKSKKSCIDKAEAARLGLYHGSVPAQPKDKAETEKPAEPPSDATPASDAAVAPPAPAPDAMPEPVPVQPAEAESPRPSPYGELVIEDFAKAK